jgi:hypothetical protein
MDMDVCDAFFKQCDRKPSVIALAMARAIQRRHNTPRSQINMNCFLGIDLDTGCLQICGAVATLEEVFNFRASPDSIRKLVNTNSGAVCPFLKSCSGQTIWFFRLQGEIDYMRSILEPEIKSFSRYSRLMSSLDEFRLGSVERILKYCDLTEEQYFSLVNSANWSLDQNSWQRNISKLEKWAKELSVAGL